MPKPLAICLEDLNAGASPRYLRCVAITGREPGLRLDGAGAVLWKSDDDASCELWVSADERLVLYRRAEGAAVRVRRGGRSLDAPPSKPVVLLDQDRVEVGGRSLRIHIHGPATRVHPPSPLPDRLPSDSCAPRAGTVDSRLSTLDARPPGGAMTAQAGLGRVAATAAALGAALGAADCKKAQAPDTAPADGKATELEVPASGPAQDVVIYVPADAGAADAGEPEIEVRERPPEMMAPPPEPETPDAGTAPDVAPADPTDGAVDVFRLEVPPDASAEPDAAEPEDARTIEVRVHPPRPVTRHDDE
ncbi:MAG: hypothetical protein HY905_25575 [Deltaproteobacteria bacterium]|nr:hypothetical protein [Deltaproteobacteria bacterium]